MTPAPIKKLILAVILAQAGIHLALSFRGLWMPTFVGMTIVNSITSRDLA